MNQAIEDLEANYEIGLACSPMKMDNLAPLWGAGVVSEQHSCVLEDAHEVMTSPLPQQLLW